MRESIKSTKERVALRPKACDHANNDLVKHVYEARVQIRVWVRCCDLAIFEKVECDCDGIHLLINY